MGCAAFKACDPCCRRLGCSCIDHDDEYGRMATISEKRSCTDLPCFAIFVAFLAFLVATVWITAFGEGDPDRLIRGVNHAGLICGKSAGVEDLPYAFWPDPMNYRFKVCTDDCNWATWDSVFGIDQPTVSPTAAPSMAPTEPTTSPTTSAPSTSPTTASPTAVTSAPSVSPTAATSAPTGSPVTTTLTARRRLPELEFSMNPNHMNPPYQSVVYADKYCIPNNGTLAIAGFDDYSQEIQRGMGDIEDAMPVIGASIAIAFVISFAFVWLMKCCVGVLVWGTCAVIVTGGAALGYALYSSKGEEGLSEHEANIREYVSYGIFALTAVFFFLIIFARKRILIAIQVIKSAGRSIGDMPMMVFFPVGPLGILIGFFFAWVYASLYIFSAGEEASNESPDDFVGQCFKAETGFDSCLQQSDTYFEDWHEVGANFTVLDYDDTIQNAFAPHFFLLLWVVQIGVYFTFTVVAGAVANWYFTERDEDGNKIRGSGEYELSNRAVCKSCCRTTRYHLGTIIYAACIIAIIQFIRWCVRYAERMMSANGKKPNKIQKILFRVVDCLLWCLECCLDKISKNALIWVSVYGDAFCPAVCGSFKLVWSNMARVAVITFFSTIVTTLGKIMIPLITTALCALVLLFTEPYASEMAAPIYPLLVIFIVSLAVAMMFLTVYDTAIDTVFLCFLLDEKHNKENGKMLADEGLRNIVQRYEAESKKLARSMQGNKVIVEEKPGGGHHQEVDEDIEI